MCLRSLESYCIDKADTLDIGSGNSVLGSQVLEVPAKPEAQVEGGALQVVEGRSRASAGALCRIHQAPSGFQALEESVGT